MTGKKQAPETDRPATLKMLAEYLDLSPALDSEARWQPIVAIAQEFGIIVHPELCIFLEENVWSPALGYTPVRNLLSRTRDFTALFCFNDTSALGAIRAIQDAGLAVPTTSPSSASTTLSSPNTSTHASPPSASRSTKWVQPPRSSSSSASSRLMSPIPTTSVLSPNSS
jgi:hypothetical protein